MAYADQQMSTRKMVSIGVVGLLHALLGYAFVTGLAYQVIKKAPTVLETFDVQEAKPPEEEPPPPPPEPEEAPPPMAPPPVIVQTAAPPPPVTVQTTIPTPPPPTITPPAPPRPTQAAPATPKGRRLSWITQDDYPGSALRAEEEGTTSIRVEIDASGRVTSCAVTGSSGSATLDDATCRLYTRRARFNPAKDAAGNPIATTYSDRVKWQMPK